MFASKDGERLYLSSWEYNAVLILDELARIAEKAGAHVKPYKTAVISNRILSGEIRELEARIEQLNGLNEANGESEKRCEAIQTACQKLKELKQIDNEPIKVYGQSWITFVLDGIYYSYSFDDNPFFDFNYKKTVINSNGEINAYACLETDKREWERGHEIYSCRMTADERSGIAREIFNMLMGAPLSEIVRRTNRVRVHNLYNDGYHYEMVPEKERYVKVDF